MASGGRVMEIRRALAGKHIILTGGTGFLGKVWLARLLQNLPEIGRVTVLVRPSKGLNPTERFAKLLDTSPAFRTLKQSHGRDYAAFVSSRIDVVAGDVTEPMCGISQADQDSILPSASLLVHCAGLTDFEPDFFKAYRANVKGARHAADLAAQMANPSLLHISTCYVAGCLSGTMPEKAEWSETPNGTPWDPEEEVTWLQNHFDSQGEHVREAQRIAMGNARARSLGWPNIYTYTKALAEAFLVRRKDVTVTIVRPSIVECAAQYPFPGWNEGLNTAGPLAWLISTPFRHLPAQPTHHFDVVPVDCVASGMTLIAGAILSGRANKVYQLAASDVNPLTLGRTIELTGLGYRRHLRKTGGSGFEHLVSQHLDPVHASTEEGMFSVGTWRNGTRMLREFISGIEPEQILPKEWYRAVGHDLEQWLRNTRLYLRQAQGKLYKIEQMLELYKPFIHDYNYTFQTDAIRAHSDALSGEERERFGYGVPQIDWRKYWVDVEYPGLAKWCFPVLRGESVPQDLPSHPPLEWVAEAAEQAKAVGK